jgi:hypothetical protein
MAESNRLARTIFALSSPHVITRSFMHQAVKSVDMFRAVIFHAA